MCVCFGVAVQLCHVECDYVVCECLGWAVHCCQGSTWCLYFLISRMRWWHGFFDVCFTLSFANYWLPPGMQACKPAYLVPVPSQDKLGGLCQRWQRWGHQYSLDGVAVIRIVDVSACVIFILHRKIQKMAKCTFWYQLIWVLQHKVQRAVKWLCVCVLLISS